MSRKRRRSEMQETESPRRVRRGPQAGGTVIVQPGKLAVLVAPSATYQTTVPGSGCSVQLKALDDQPIAQAGIIISVDVPLAPSVLASPVQAVTDASGVAVFDSLTVTGPLGGFTFTFTAPGWQGVTTTGHQLTAGPPAASGTYASAPGGVEDALLTVSIFLCDAASNRILTNPGGVTVTVQITGVNARAQSNANYTTNGIWAWSYTPATPTGATPDQAIVKLNGVAISGSPYSINITSAQSGFTPSRSLRFGWAQGEVVQGPHVDGSGQFTTAQPVYHAALDHWGPSNLMTALTDGDSYDVCLMNNVEGPKSTWCINGTASVSNPGTFSPKLAINTTKIYHTSGGLNTTDANRITAALASRRLITYGFDEPYHKATWREADGSTPAGGSSIWPWHIKMWARKVKKLWPNSLILGQFNGGHIQLPTNLDANAITNGWQCTHSGLDDNENIIRLTNYSSGGGIMPDGVHCRHLPQNYFDAVDYCWSSYFGMVTATQPRGMDNQANGFKTAAEFYPWMHDMARRAGYGYIPWEHHCNHGTIGLCWNAHNSSPAVNNSQITGKDSNAPGTIIACPQTISGEFWWGGRPQQIIDEMNAVLAIKDADGTTDIPIMLMWAHPDSSVMGSAGWTGSNAFDKRPDYVAAALQCLNLANSRNIPVVWRTPKFSSTW